VEPRGVRYFLEAAARGRPDRILEVGPGPGTLTYWLSNTLGVPVAGVELDRRLVKAAAAESGHPLATYVAGDGVEHARAATASMLVSNTPYNVSSRIIAVSARNNSLRRLVLGVQREVALRVTASPGTPDYGRLTLLANRYFHVEPYALLPRSWFYPRPEVDGMIILLSRKRDWRPGDECFEKLTACLFSARNKKAVKVAARCTGLDPSLLSRLLGDKRVRELTLRDVEWLVENGGCTSGRG